MNKLVFIMIFFVSLLQAGVFGSDKVTFKHADSDIDRKYPTQKEYILSYNNVLEDIRTSVVNISTEKSLSSSRGYANPFFNDPFFREFFKGFGEPRFNIPQERVERSLGSGVIMTNDGYIVTNNHVVEGADKIKVSIPGIKKEYDAELIGSDPKSDIAVVKIKAKELNSITLFDSDKVKIGDIVFAIGNPFAVGETITQGIVSATKRSSVGIVEYEDFIQTDAPINPGNSGGALINSAGYLIGINSAIMTKSGGNVGIGFAIPSNMVQRIAQSLIEDGKFTRAYLGVSISDVTEDISGFYGENFGALITSVEKDTPAQKADIKRGDLIIGVNDKKIKSAGDLRNTIGTMKPGSKITLHFLRDKKLYEKSVKLESRDTKNDDSGYAYEYEGMKIEPLTDASRKELGLRDNIQGVLVASVKDNSVSNNAGITQSDIIVQIESNEISNIDEFKTAVAKKGKKRFYIYRRGFVYVVIM